MKTLICFASVLLSLSSLAQSNYASDVASADAIVNALYDVISGKPNEERDWNRFKYLFTPDAKLIPTAKNQESKISYATLTPEQYIQNFRARVVTGFYEKELNRMTDAYGTIVHVFSTYETREGKDGPVTNRGINSIQLLKTHERYFIMNIFWCGENTGFLLPDVYLKGRIE